MRYYTRRAPRGFRTVAQQKEMARLSALTSANDVQRQRLDALYALVSDRIEIIDGTGNMEAFDVHERDAEQLCAYLNIGDRQEMLCQV